LFAQKTNQQRSGEKGQPDHIGPLKAGLPCAVRKERTFWKVALLRQNVFPVLCCTARQSDDGLNKYLIFFLKPILSR
jgi:hypothetical protein